LTNTSFRVTSTVRDLKAGVPMQERFLVFAGPKRPELLAEYDLGDVITYGWFGPVAKLLLAILHTFYAAIPNYGVAIVLLTVLVRGCMFPLSKKQALSAQKMQELQPEIKKIQEKYKNNLEARGKAQQELFRKHNYNPMGGCLILFLQLPIFVGLYRGLMVDVELRGAPLISESIRWASDLAAPDMLFDWSGFMPAFVTRGTGMFGLGPYFNLLPIITIVLFLWQQKKFMPPPADEQAAMQQRIMQFMMVFMGILFFKVASGLCIYFVASSLWSIAERQFLPKTKTAGQGGPAESSPPPRSTSGRDGATASRRKARGRRE
jgi:YidC/Oxa1 family membrane protein insertase